MFALSRLVRRVRTSLTKGMGERDASPPFPSPSSLSQTIPTLKAGKAFFIIVAFFLSVYRILVSYPFFSFQLSVYRILRNVNAF